MKNQKHLYDNPVIFSTPHQWAGEIAYKIYQILQEDYKIETCNHFDRELNRGDFTIKSVCLKYETLQFSLSGDGMDLYITRISGNKYKFYELVALIQSLDV